MSEKPIPQPNCPADCRVDDGVPLAHVADVDRAAEFYALLGFRCDSRFSGEDGLTNYVSLSSRTARIMLARANTPIEPSQQAVLFYMYSPDVVALRRHLLTCGLREAGPTPDERACGMPPPPDRNAAFQLRYPFYMPAGELRVHDLDGYCILIGQLK
jgi:hypothetical protein